MQLSELHQQITAAVDAYLDPHNSLASSEDIPRPPDRDATQSRERDVVDALTQDHAYRLGYTYSYPITCKGSYVHTLAQRVDSVAKLLPPEVARRLQWSVGFSRDLSFRLHDPATDSPRPNYPQ